MPRQQSRRRQPQRPSKNSASTWARELFASRNFYVLDTETTGFRKIDEIVQIGIVDKNGEVVMNTLVKPTIPMPREVINIHSITDDMLTDAPDFSEIYTRLSVLLAGQPVVAYNMNFDWRLLLQSGQRYGLPPIQTGKRHCAMKRYAEYRGVRGARGYRSHKLVAACQHEKITVKNAHDALGDVRMTLALIRKMAGK